MKPMETQTPKRPFEKCPKCDGRGTVPLSDELTALLTAIRKARGPVGSDELPSGGCGETGRNNRLLKLEGLGLVKRVGKRSKTVLWAAVRKQTGAVSAQADCYAGPLTKDTIRKAALWLDVARRLTELQIKEMRRHGLIEEAAEEKGTLPILEQVTAELNAALHNAEVSRGDR